MKFSFNSGRIPANQFYKLKAAIKTVNQMVAEPTGGVITRGADYPDLFLNVNPNEMKNAIDTLYQFYKDCYRIIHIYYVIEVLIVDQQHFMLALGERVNHNDIIGFNPNNVKTHYTRTIEIFHVIKNYNISMNINMNAKLNSSVASSIEYSKSKKIRFLTQHEYDTLMHYFKIHSANKIVDMLNL